MSNITARQVLRIIGLAVPFAVPCSTIAQSMEASADAHRTQGPAPGSYRESGSSSYSGGVYGWTLDDVSTSIRGATASIHPSSTSGTLSGTFSLLDKSSAWVPGRGEASAATAYDFLLDVPVDGFYRFTLTVDVMTGSDGNPYFGDASASFAMSDTWSGTTNNDMEVMVSKFLTAGSYEIKGGTMANSYSDITGHGYAQVTQHFTLSPVPEPASLGLFALGLAGTFAAVRRRRNRATESAG